MDKIVVVEPHDVSTLTIEKGEDFVTLVTCTPYGINSHRLLVRGTRVNAGGGSDWERIEVGSDVKEISATLLTFVSFIAIIVVVFIVLLIRSRRTNRKEE